MATPSVKEASLIHSSCPEPRSVLRRSQAEALVRGHNPLLDDISQKMHGPEIHAD